MDHGPLDQWTNGPINQWTRDQWTDGPMVQCIAMGQWFNGPEDQWTNKPMDQWTNGPKSQSRSQAALKCLSSTMQLRATHPMHITIGKKQIYATQTNNAV